MVEDLHTNWPEDAAAFERHFGPDLIPDDRPEPSDFPAKLPQHVCWRNGGVECRRCDLDEEQADAGRVEVGAITAAFLLCLIGICLFALALMGGQHVVCWMNGNAVSYCPGYTAVTK